MNKILSVKNFSNLKIPNVHCKITNCSKTHMACLNYNYRKSETNTKKK